MSPANTYLISLLSNTDFAPFANAIFKPDALTSLQGFKAAYAKYASNVGALTTNTIGLMDTLLDVSNTATSFFNTLSSLDTLTNAALKTEAQQFKDGANWSYAKVKTYFDTALTNLVGDYNGKITSFVNDFGNQGFTITQPAALTVANFVANVDSTTTSVTDAAKTHLTTLINAVATIKTYFTTQAQLNNIDTVQDLANISITASPFKVVNTNNSADKTPSFSTRFQQYQFYLNTVYRVNILDYITNATTGKKVLDDIIGNCMLYVRDYYNAYTRLKSVYTSLPTITEPRVNPTNLSGLSTIVAPAYKSFDHQTLLDKYKTDVQDFVRQYNDLYSSYKMFIDTFTTENIRNFFGVYDYPAATSGITHATQTDTVTGVGSLGTIAQGFVGAANARLPALLKDVVTIFATNTTGYIDKFTAMYGLLPTPKTFAFDASTDKSVLNGINTKSADTFKQIVNKYTWMTCKYTAAWHYNAFKDCLKISWMDAFLPKDLSFTIKNYETPNNLSTSSITTTLGTIGLLSGTFDSATTTILDAQNLRVRYHTALVAAFNPTVANVQAEIKDYMVLRDFWKTLSDKTGASYGVTAASIPALPTTTFSGTTDITGYTYANILSSTTGIYAFKAQVEPYLNQANTSSIQTCRNAINQYMLLFGQKFSPLSQNVSKILPVSITLPTFPTVASQTKTTDFIDFVFNVFKAAKQLAIINLWSMYVYARRIGGPILTAADKTSIEALTGTDITQITSATYTGLATLAHEKNVSKITNVDTEFRCVPLLNNEIHGIDLITAYNTLFDNYTAFVTNVNKQTFDTLRNPPKYPVADTGVGFVKSIDTLPGAITSYNVSMDLSAIKTYVNKYEKNSYATADTLSDGLTTQLLPKLLSSVRAELVDYIGKYNTSKGGTATPTGITNPTNVANLVGVMSTFAANTGTLLQNQAKTAADAATTAGLRTNLTNAAVHFKTLYDGLKTNFSIDTYTGTTVSSLTYKNVYDAITNDTVTNLNTSTDAQLTTNISKYCDAYRSLLDYAKTQAINSITAYGSLRTAYIELAKLTTVKSLTALNTTTYPDMPTTSVNAIAAPTNAELTGTVFGTTNSSSVSTLNTNITTSKSNLTSLNSSVITPLVSSDTTSFRAELGSLFTATGVTGVTMPTYDSTQPIASMGSLAQTAVSVATKAFAAAYPLLTDTTQQAFVISSPTKLSDLAANSAIADNSSLTAAVTRANLYFRGLLAITYMNFTNLAATFPTTTWTTQSTTIKGYITGASTANVGSATDIRTAYTNYKGSYIATLFTDMRAFVTSSINNTFYKYYEDNKTVLEMPNIAGTPNALSTSITTAVTNKSTHLANVSSATADAAGASTLKTKYDLFFTGSSSLYATLQAEKTRLEALGTARAAKLSEFARWKGYYDTYASRLVSYSLAITNYPTYVSGTSGTATFNNLNEADVKAIVVDFAGLYGAAKLATQGLVNEYKGVYETYQTFWTTYRAQYTAADKAFKSLDDVTITNIIKANSGRSTYLSNLTTLDSLTYLGDSTFTQLNSIFSVYANAVSPPISRLLNTIGPLLTSYITNFKTRYDQTFDKATGGAVVLMDLGTNLPVTPYTTATYNTDVNSLKTPTSAVVNDIISRYGTFTTTFIMEDKRLAALLNMSDYYKIVKRFRDIGVLPSNYSSDATRELATYVGSSGLTTTFSDLPTTGTGTATLEQVAIRYGGTYMTGLVADIKNAITPVVKSFVERPEGTTESVYERYCKLQSPPLSPQSNTIFGDLFYGGTTSMKTTVAIVNGVYADPAKYQQILAAMNFEKLGAEMQKIQRSMATHIKFGDAKRPFSLL